MSIVKTTGWQTLSCAFNIRHKRREAISMLGSQILRPLSLVSTDGGHANLRVMPFWAPALVQ
jgi:hypothetical protein